MKKEKSTTENNHPARDAGITLAELMMALPLATIILLVLFSALFTQYTSVLAESARANLRSNGQSLLINLQDELLFTIAFGETLHTDLNDAYAPVGGWVHNTDPQTLIINEIALDSTRRDEDRHIVRRQINPCETSSITSNPVAVDNVIYFLQDVEGSPYDRLMKRTIVPTYSTCSIDLVSGAPCEPTTPTCKNIEKQTSCPLQNVGQNNCSEKDTVLSENVLDMQIEYFQANNISTAFPSAADKIEITLTLGDRVFGKDVEAVVKHTIRKIN